MKSASCRTRLVTMTSTRSICASTRSYGASPRHSGWYCARASARTPAKYLSLTPARSPPQDRHHGRLATLMDPRLLDYYNRELQFVREMGAEFAQAYPRIAARLGIEGLECADPYVERLLESFAFLTARVQLKLDARHPDFTQHLLELVYPHFLCPVPACAIVEIVPDMKEGSLQTGHNMHRGTSLRTPLGKGERTACEFRTAHGVTLWPV